MKLFDSEWKVMEVLWQENDRTAKEISLRLADSIGWNKNTTYTVIKKCIDFLVARNYHLSLFNIKI